MDGLEETRRVMEAGAWIYVTVREPTVGEDATPEALSRLFNYAEFAFAGPAEEAYEDGENVLRGIFRKVDAETSA